MLLLYTWEFTDYTSYNSLYLKYFFIITVMIQCFLDKQGRTRSDLSGSSLFAIPSASFADRSGQTVQTQIRLLLGEQSDQGFHCLLFHLHLFDEIPLVLGLCLNFR